MAIDVGTTSDIRNWHSIITLIVFVLTNIIVLFPFHIPLYVPRVFANAVLNSLSALRIISARTHDRGDDHVTGHEGNGDASSSFLVRFQFPMNFVTAPLIADLFLLAISAIGKDEVRGGTVGTENISPLEIMAFFFTLAYIAISIDASGLIRYLAFKVLQKGGKVGHRLFFYLYAFFFSLASFIGNDPIILSGTAFLAYMTRVSSNIIHPRAWIHTQFAIANIASAILVSSNPTNLVLAGAFNIKFIVYTANMIVPVVVTAIVLAPFLLYIVFNDESLIPSSIEMHELSDEAKARDPVNPNIPNARGNAEEEEKRLASNDEGMLLSLEEIMNPFLDKKGAFFGAAIMAITLITLLALNAATTDTKEHPVFWVTTPAAFLMLCCDIAFGWYHRKETRAIAQKGREEVERARAERAILEELEQGSQPTAESTVTEKGDIGAGFQPVVQTTDTHRRSENSTSSADNGIALAPRKLDSSNSKLVPGKVSGPNHGSLANTLSSLNPKDGAARSNIDLSTPTQGNYAEMLMEPNKLEQTFTEKVLARVTAGHEKHGHTTLVSLLAERYRWAQETFPTVTVVISHLPFALLPFSLAMFVLVQALVTKGWVPVFAYGWDHWVNRTGTVGAIGGMAFLSVILCNFAGTNIGTTILLSRVIQAWQTIHRDNGIPITDRTFWATVYSMALGVNYGAFSTAFSASLAGLLWRDILARKHIHVGGLEFARVNLPIIAIAMAVGCAVLTGEVYIVRNNNNYHTGT